MRSSMADRAARMAAVVAFCGSDAEFIGKQVSLAVERVERTGGETVVTAQVGGNGFNGPSHFSFRVEGGRVSRMTIRA